MADVVEVHASGEAPVAASKRAFVNDALANMSGLFPKEDIFDDIFRVQNFMVQVEFDCLLGGSARTAEGAFVKLPLMQVHRKIPYCFYGPWTFPAMLMFNPQHGSTALVYAVGSMIIVGCSAADEVNRNREYFVNQLTRAVGACTGTDGAPYECRAAGVWLKNRMFSNKVGGKRIDVVGIHDHAMKHGWLTKLTQRKINILTMYPFKSSESPADPLLSKTHDGPLTRVELKELDNRRMREDGLPSITCCVFPAGGVNVMGVYKLEEIEFAKEFLSRVLGPFLRDEPGFDRAKYDAHRAEKRAGAREKRIKRCVKTVRKWNKKEAAFYRLRLYELWEGAPSEAEAKRLTKPIHAKYRLELRLRHEYKAKWRKMLREATEMAKQSDLAAVERKMLTVLNCMRKRRGTIQEFCPVGVREGCVESFDVALYGPGNCGLGRRDVPRPALS